MIQKKFDYQEFTKVKSLNCESCGGGLTINISNGKTCDCKYCGNTNMILEDGKTKVIPKEVAKPAPKEGEVTGSGMKSSTAIMIGMIVLGVVGVGAYLIYKKMKEKEKISGKRKRLLLLTK